ncbi:hypothetical protein AYX07_06425 [Thermoactinomyces sp. AS95]|jgi:hypothetical protein|uniref:hypothetical protein n=1 Tax=Thermoactinomyces vulgaris TaxID=2026 RepID=UPI0005085419|nr:hypothetical protein [Thermoactinomyces vulgaris]KFZ40847.1 hypothetical protein JS81_05405 [Thermoactinomyces sp. Gus2-1]KYQ86776.1 hypothetical protein AYX07_06425 [Thermoactinomyces sp. AS95]
MIILVRFLPEKDYGGCMISNQDIHLNSGVEKGIYSLGDYVIFFTKKPYSPAKIGSASCHNKGEKD